MKSFRSLYIPIHILVTASGIERTIITRDISSGLLPTKEKKYIWYRDAIQYVFKKWEEGKTDMYDPHGVDVDNNIQSRILSRIDDEIGVDNLAFAWKD